MALGARPEKGEGIVTGDVVNTASRLQGAAPVNGIAVSEQTYRQTERVFDYEELAPAQVKGKSDPLVVFRPLAARARFGTDVTRTHTTPLVGRELEKSLIIGTFERAAKQSSCQLVTIVGEPGAGKSRLCMELFNFVDDRPVFTRWRQGRCLPYGDGIAFWALGEIVKAECGIFDTDSVEDAEAKLERALSGEDSDLLWLKARLAPLVGVPGEPVAQEETFAAWRSFCEPSPDGACGARLRGSALGRPGAPRVPRAHGGVGGRRAAPPALHRPSRALRAASRVRGEREKRTADPPAAADGRRDRPPRGLAARAIAPARGDAAGPPRARRRQPPLRRGVRAPALGPRRCRQGRGGTGIGAGAHRGAPRHAASGAEEPAPGRRRPRQGLLGRRARGNGGRDLAEVEQALHELSRKELVRPARTSSMEEEAEYGFWHVLVRDVCYAQIPRAARAARHRAAVAWIERKAAERLEDVADVLAYHCLQALELGRAAGDADTADVEEGAIRYLGLAGERALSLDVERAEATSCQGARALSCRPR